MLAEIYDEDPSKIVIREEFLEYRFKDLVEGVPTAKWKKNKWLINLTWPTAIALKNNLGDRLQVSPELSQWMADYYTNKILPSFNLRSVTSSDEGLEMLFPHQRADVHFLATARRAILANGMGSGKSISATATLRHIKEVQGEDVFPVLIACPSSTKLSWAREFEKAYPGRNITVIDGSAAARRKQFKKFIEEDGEVLVINWESIRIHSRLKPYGGTALKKCVECGGLDANVKTAACEAHTKELNEIDFKSIIGDEIHRISDPSSKTARSFKYASGNADIRIGMSGTPIMSTPDDLFSALNWLYPEAYTSKTQFLDRYCESTENQWGGVTVTGIKRDMEKEFFAGLDPILRRMPKEVILPFLPPILRDRRDVEMSAKQAKAYKQMNEQMIAELDNDDVIFTTSPLTKMGRMLQFASAFGELQEREVYDKFSPIPNAKKIEEYLVLTDPSCKVDAFMDDIKDFGDDSVVVFAQSKQLIMLLANRLEKEGYTFGLITGDQDSAERQAYMDAFQAGHLPFILCTIQAGGTGITLTKARTMVFLQRSWSMIDNLQAEGRSHRIGSEVHDSIQIIDYVTKGSIEEIVFEAIERKMGNLEFILRDKDLIRRTLQADTDVVNEESGKVEEDGEEDGGILSR